MKITERGLELIKGFESFSGELYDDDAGHATIGYGHLVHRGRVGTDPVAEKPFLGGIDEPHARILLAGDCGRAVLALERLIVHEVLETLHATSFDALVSFTFNLGPDALRGSKLLAYVNDGELVAAAKQFERWCHAGRPPVEMRGLLRRRFAEAAMFLDY